MINAVDTKNNLQPANSWLNFESTSLFCKSAQNEASKSELNQEIHEYVAGIYLYKSVDGSLIISNEQNKKINGSSTLNRLFDKTIIELKKILEFCEKKKFNISFVEISTFDPLDITEVDHYYLYFSTSLEYIRIYNKQTNLSVFSHFYRQLHQRETPETKGRGYLLPSLGLLRHPYFSVKCPGKISSHLSSDRLNLQDTNDLFIASGKFVLDEETSNIPDKGDKTKAHVKNFLKAVLHDFLQSDEPINLKYTSYGLLIPIFRPAGRNKDYHSQYEELNYAEFRYRGGGIFIVGWSILKNINFDKFVLYFNSSLRDKGIMASSVNKLAVQKEASSSFGHEIKQVSGGLSGRWLLEPRSLFEIVNKELADTDKIGKIEVWQPEIFKQIYIAPF